MKSPIERREFGKVILSSALSAAAAAAETTKPRASRPWPPGIKISVQMPGDPSDEDLQFVNQLGCRYVNIPASGKTATYENFARMKNKVESAGLLVWNIGNSDVHNMEEGLGPTVVSSGAIWVFGDQLESGSRLRELCRSSGLCATLEPDHDGKTLDDPSHRIVEP